MRSGIVFFVVLVVFTECQAHKGRLDESTAYASAESGGKQRDEHHVDSTGTSIHVSASVGYGKEEEPFFVQEHEEEYEPEPQPKYKSKKKFEHKKYKHKETSEPKEKYEHHTPPSKHHPPPPPPPPPPKPKPVYSPFPIDFSTTESSLRTRIFQADVEKAAKVLYSPKVLSLGAGLTYPDELSFLLGAVGDRNKNPDVVAFKALAKAALQTKESSKLATALVLSFTPNCSCSVMSAEENDELLEGFKKDFENRKELIEILTADANKDTPYEYGRRLQAAGASPVSAFACSHCWPRKQCRRVRWCRRRKSP